MMFLDHPADLNHVVRKVRLALQNGVAQIMNIRRHQHQPGIRRDKPRGPAAHGCGHRAWCGRFAGAGALKIPGLGRVVVGGRESTRLGTWLAGDLLRDHKKR